MKRGILLFAVFILLGWPTRACLAFPLVPANRIAPIMRVSRRLSFLSHFGGGHSPKLRSPSRLMVSLYAKKPQNEFNETETQRLDTESDGFLLLLDFDPTILFVDIITVAIACQLLGLLDVVNDPAFWKNGGWLQPIPAAPSTLPILVQRFSINGILYVGTALFLGSLVNDAVAAPKTVLWAALRTSSVFSLVRLIVGVTLAATISSEGDFSATQQLDVVLELLRECYFVALATTAGRYVIYRLFYHR